MEPIAVNKDHRLTARFAFRLLAVVAIAVSIGSAYPAGQSAQAQQRPYVADPVAARPHDVTIVLGLLSPILAVVAIAVSLRSMYLTRQSNQTAQRAYVAVTKSDIAVKPMDAILDDRFGSVGEESRSMLSYFDVK